MACWWDDQQQSGIVSTALGVCCHGGFADCLLVGSSSGVQYSIHSDRYMS
jgi:hypothetical protein